MITETALSPDIGAHVHYANTGGPRSRTRKEPISSTILGKDDGYIKCPRVIRLGLIFTPGADPVEVVQSMLREEGYSTPNELRNEFNVPLDRLICVPLKDTLRRLEVKTAEPRQVLEQALFLGLCTNHIFDAERPILWTETSITRGLELFDPTGFYS